MGTIILVIIAFIEVSLGIYCIVTKSNQKRTRSWTRIGMFAAFILFTLLSLIQWSFRWIPLAAILLITAAAGGVSLLRRKSPKKKFNAVSVIFKEIAILLVAVIAVTPALIFPQYKLPETTGKYSVKTVVYTYTDKGRIETFSKTGGNREVNVEFWYPENPQGKVPLVVFSHGAFGVKSSNTSTFRELAANGYVVCSVDHPYHSFFTVDTSGRVTLVDGSFMQEVGNSGKGVYDDRTDFEITHKWLKLRTDDMNFVLDTILMNAKNESSLGVYRLIDTGRIGLFGHSLGGAASAQLGRERRDIGAVIDIDGSLIGEQVSYTDGKYIMNQEIYPVPMLGIYTDAMTEAIAKTEAAYPDLVLPEKRIPETAPNAFVVHFAGTNHMSVTDLSYVSPFLVNLICGTFKNNGGVQQADKYYVLNTMNKLIREFFDCYLKGQGSFHSAKEADCRGNQGRQKRQ